MACWLWTPSCSAGRHKLPPTRPDRRAPHEHPRPDRSATHDTGPVGTVVPRCRLDSARPGAAGRGAGAASLRYGDRQRASTRGRRAGLAVVLRPGRHRGRSAGAGRGGHARLLASGEAVARGLRQRACTDDADRVLAGRDHGARIDSTRQPAGRARDRAVGPFRPAAAHRPRIGSDAPDAWRCGCGDAGAGWPWMPWHSCRTWGPSPRSTAFPGWAMASTSAWSTPSSAG